MHALLLMVMPRGQEKRCLEEVVVSSGGPASRSSHMATLHLVQVKYGSVGSVWCCAGVFSEHECLVCYVSACPAKCAGCIRQSLMSVWPGWWRALLCKMLVLLAALVVQALAPDMSRASGLHNLQQPASQELVPGSAGGGAAQERGGGNADLATAAKAGSEVLGQGQDDHNTDAQAGPGHIHTQSFTLGSKVLDSWARAEFASEEQEASESMQGGEAGSSEGAQGTEAGPDHLLRAAVTGARSITMMASSVRQYSVSEANSPHPREAERNPAVPRADSSFGGRVFGSWSSAVFASEEQETGESMQGEEAGSSEGAQHSARTASVSHHGHCGSQGSTAQDRARIQREADMATMTRASSVSQEKVGGRGEARQGGPSLAVATAGARTCGATPSSYERRNEEEIAALRSQLKEQREELQALMARVQRAESVVFEQAEPSSPDQGPVRASSSGSAREVQGGVGEGRSEWSGVRDPRGSGPVSVPVPGAARPAGARLPAPQDSPADIPSESESGSWSTPGAGALRSEGSQEGVLRKGARRADVGETGLGWEEDEEARRWVSAFCLECDEERGENGVWCVRG